MQPTSSGPATQRILRAHDNLNSGPRFLFGLGMMFFGQLITLLAGLSEPSNDADLETLIQYTNNLKTISMFVVLLNLIGMILIISTSKTIFDFVTDAVKKQNDNMRLMAEMINKNRRQP
jgi:hypothetical protein